MKSFVIAMLASFFAALFLHKSYANLFNGILLWQALLLDIFFGVCVYILL